MGKSNDLSWVPTPALSSEGEVPVADGQLGSWWAFSRGPVQPEKAWGCGDSCPAVQLESSLLLGRTSGSPREPGSESADWQRLGLSRTDPSVGGSDSGELFRASSEY